MEEYRKTLTAFQIAMGCHCLDPVSRSKHEQFEDMVLARAREEFFEMHPNADPESVRMEVSSRIEIVGEWGKHRINGKVLLSYQEFVKGFPLRASRVGKYIAVGSVDHKTCEAELLSLEERW